MAFSKQLNGLYSDFFVCGICNKLAIRPQSHDGGYGQDFCQRVFCEVCVGVRAENPCFQRAGRYGGFETICPTPNCRITFKPPYFRKLGIIEKICYNNLTVDCHKCDKRFEVHNFLAHVAKCKGKDSASAVQPVWFGDARRLVPNPANQSTIIKIIHNERLRLISNNMLRWKNNKPDSIVNMYFRTLGLDFQYSMPTVLDIKEALKLLASFKNLDEDSIDVVYVGHVSMRQFETVYDFLQLMPDCSDFNLVGQSKNFSNPDIDLRFQIVTAHPKRQIAAVADEASQVEA